MKLCFLCLSACPYSAVVNQASKTHSNNESKAIPDISPKAVVSFFLFFFFPFFGHNYAYLYNSNNNNNDNNSNKKHIFLCMTATFGPISTALLLQ